LCRRLSEFSYPLSWPKRCKCRTTWWASRVDATVKLADGFLDLTIRDNGRGFSEAIAATWETFAGSEKLAPVSIRSRVSDLGGTLHIINSPQGAELQIRLAAT